jgi:hypothetical protein
MLRLPKDVPRKRKLARAEEVLYMLGLGECANTLVGGPLLKVRRVAFRAQRHYSVNRESSF